MERCCRTRGFLSEEEEREALVGTFDRGLCDLCTLQRACAGPWRRTVPAPGFTCQQRPADKPVQEGLTSSPLLIQAGSFQTRLLPRFPLSVCVCVCVCLVAQSHPTHCDPMDYSPSGSSVHGDSPGKNTGVGCHTLLQGIFPTQGLNPGFPLFKQILYQLSYQRSPEHTVINPKYE